MLRSDPDRLFKLMELCRTIAGSGLVDLARQGAHRFLEADEIFGGRQRAQRLADLGEALLEIAERACIDTGLPAQIQSFGERADFRFERFDGAARHRLGQRAADLGEIAAQRGERVPVGLMQRSDLRGDGAQMMLKAGQIGGGRRISRCDRRSVTNRWR